MSKGIKSLSATYIITLLKTKFGKIKDFRTKNVKITMSDAVMSIFAMFKLKMPSLLKIVFDYGKRLLNYTISR